MFKIRFITEKDSLGTLHNMPSPKPMPRYRGGVYQGNLHLGLSKQLHIGSNQIISQAMDNHYHCTNRPG